MNSKKTIAISGLIIFLGAFLLTSCSSKKYCRGGKKHYKRVKRDTGMMVF